VVFQVKEIQTTPNPNALKFVLSGKVTDRAISFRDPGEASGFPIAVQLLSIPGVRNLLFLNDFVTIGKSGEASWTSIRRRVSHILESELFEDFQRNSPGFANPGLDRT